MNSRIIVDSCCDLTAEMKTDMGVSSVPLTMTADGEEFHDDENLDMSRFMDKVKRFSGKVRSAAPSPHLFQKAVENAADAFIVTLSSKLSGSHNNAVVGVRDASAGGKVHVFDSKSASAGETLIAIKIHELITAGVSRERIIETVHKFIDEMKTYFVLENYDNLMKNGRLGKVAGTFVRMFNIKLVMGSDGNGEIGLFGKCIGVNKMLQHLINLISDSGRETDGQNCVISHCDNPTLAEQLKSLIKERFRFKKIYVVPTGGLSSLYADDKGIILAF